MSFIWSFKPDGDDHGDYRPYAPAKRRERRSSWVAPEHAKGALGMRKDFMRNERGEAISTDKRFVVDNRPQIMIPERPRKFLTFS